MGRIKDLIIELQNEYGYELENLPEGFSMDEYLEMKSHEIKPLSSIDRDTFKYATKASYTEQLFCEQVKNRK